MTNTGINAMYLEDVGTGATTTTGQGIAPAQVAVDRPEDDHEQLCKNRLYNNGVRQYWCLSSMNPKSTKVAAVWFLICIREGQMGVGAISSALSNQWSVMPHLVNELRRQLLGLYRLAVILTTPALHPTEVLATHEEAEVAVVLKQGVCAATHPRAEIWASMDELIQVIQAKIDYLDVKEAERVHANAHQAHMMAVEGVGQHLTAQQRRIHNLELLGYRGRGGYHQQGYGNRGNGGYGGRGGGGRGFSMHQTLSTLLRYLQPGGRGGDRGRDFGPRGRGRGAGVEETK